MLHIVNVPLAAFGGHEFVKLLFGNHSVHAFHLFNFTGWRGGHIVIGKFVPSHIIQV